MKKVTRPQAHAISKDESLIFHTSYDDGLCETSAVKAGDSEWALHDTGATHHVFKERKFFINEKFKLTEDPRKRLKLAGGDVSLNVKGQGSVVMKAGDGTVFELTNCLWVPKLSRNLIAGGVLKTKGIREVFDSSDATNFALV